MEYYGRRNRRGSHRSRTSNSLKPMYVGDRPPKDSVLTGFCSFLLMCSLVAIIYIMLDYHCNICNKKCDLYNITKSLDDIAHNISRLKVSYSDLEKSIMKFSHDIPKIEGQIGILEALANTMESGDFVWNPKTHLALPDVDVFLKKTDVITENTTNELKNVTAKMLSTELQKIV